MGMIMDQRSPPPWHNKNQATHFLMINNEDDFVRYRNHIHDGSRTYPMQPVSQQALDALL